MLARGCIKVIRDWHPPRALCSCSCAVLSWMYPQPLTSGVRLQRCSRSAAFKRSLQSVCLFECYCNASIIIVVDSRSLELPIVLSAVKCSSAINSLFLFSCGFRRAERGKSCSLLLLLLLFCCRLLLTFTSGELHSSISCRWTARRRFRKA